MIWRRKHRAVDVLASYVFDIEFFIGFACVCIGVCIVGCYLLYSNVLCLSVLARTLL